MTKFVEKLNCLSSEEATTNQNVNNNNIIHNGFQIVQNNGNFNNINPNQINGQNNDNYSNFNPIITVNPNNNHHFIPTTDTSSYGNNPAIIYNNPYNVPTNYATNPNTASYFKIRNVAASRMCLTLKRTTNTDGDDDIMKVGLKPCQQSNSAKQSWRLNPETAYIHSAVDESKCLTPNVEGDDDKNININRKKKRTRLIVKTCPYFTENIFLWHFSPDGLMKNKKKDVNGHPFLVQASRGFKQNGNQEELLLIPTLSRYPYNNLNEYYRWTLVPV